MINLEELNRSKDEYPKNLLKICQDQKLIRKNIHDKEKMDDWERRHFEIAEQKEKLRYMYGWKELFMP